MPTISSTHCKNDNKKIYTLWLLNDIKKFKKKLYTYFNWSYVVEEDTLVELGKTKQMR